jgi:hypothetical protein
MLVRCYALLEREAVNEMCIPTYVHPRQIQWPELVLCFFFALMALCDCVWNLMFDVIRRKSSPKEIWTARFTKADL